MCYTVIQRLGEGTMAKPIKDNPVIRGKAARQFREMFLAKTAPSPKRVEQNKKDIEIYMASTGTFDESIL